MCDFSALRGLFSFSPANHLPDHIKYEIFRFISCDEYKCSVSDFTNCVKITEFANKFAKESYEVCLKVEH